MSWTTPRNAISSAALALMGTLTLQGAWAAPPTHPQFQPQMTARPQALMQSRAANLAPLPQHLDLRAPAHLPDAVDEEGDRGFPSRRINKLGAQDAAQLPELGTESARARPTVQEFVRRVRREGLPVARIFEGKSALVHLGLNPKGKPGLWLVQKTR